MKLNWATLVGVSVLAAFSMPGRLQAQDAGRPGDIALVETQTVKPGMMKQYEAGRKQLAAWRKQRNDPKPLDVWMTVSGEHAGSYVISRLGYHWADFDKPAIPESTEVDKFMEVMGGAVESVVPRYYAYLEKDSNSVSPSASQGPPKMIEVITFEVRYGHAADFRSAIRRIAEAAQKTKWPVDYGWYALANGGRAGTYALVLPRANWADFEDKPSQKPFEEMLKDAFGQSEADSILKRLDTSVESEFTELLEYRSDLSYMPGK